MAALFGRCVYKGNCELNCQVFVSEDGGNSASSVCLACKHLAAFHTQGTTGNSISVASFSRPPVVEKTSTNEGVTASSTSTAVNEAKKFGKTKSFAEWKADKTSSAFRKKSKVSNKSQEPESVTINIGLMLFDEKVMGLKAKWGKKLPIKITPSASYIEILEMGLAKWKAFHKDYIREGLEYKLLFEDGTEARFLPGQSKEFFTLSRYKEELGRDYRRITLFLCTEEDFERNYHCTFDSSSDGDEQLDDTSFSGGREKRQKTDCPEVNVVSLAKQPCSGGFVEHANLKESDADMFSHSSVGSLNNLPSDQLYEESSSYVVPEDFLWGDVSVINEDELLKAAIARSLQDQRSTAEEIELQHLIETFQKENARTEMCSIVILRKRLLQTCMMSIQDKNFEFSKVPCVVFSGEDSADLGGPRREFFRLLMQQGIKELGVFEGPSNNVAFSHDHSVLAGRKPYLAGNLVAWSILHGGPGPQCLSEDVFYLMLDQEEKVVLARAVSAIVDESSAKLARELMESKTDDQLEEFNRINSDWLLDQGISTYKVDQNAMLGQIVKQALLYRSA